MPSTDEVTRTQKPHGASVESPQRPIIGGDGQRSAANAGAVLGLDQKPNALSPDEVDDQIRRFFEQKRL
jgi:hypothetical protein